MYWLSRMQFLRHLLLFVGFLTSSCQLAFQRKRFRMNDA